MKLERLWWVIGIMLILAALVICLAPAHEIPGAFELNDKLSHLIGHGGLALYFAGLVPRARWWKIFVFLLLFGTVVEFAQYLMHVGREADARDVAFNCLGAGLGLMCARLGLHRWPEFAERLLGQRRPAQ